ncbi:MAG: hypothetical protein WKG01_15775 [Kofleriaceae bacterium]
MLDEGGVERDELKRAGHAAAQVVVQLAGLLEVQRARRLLERLPADAGQVRPSTLSATP